MVLGFGWLPNVPARVFLPIDLGGRPFFEEVQEEWSMSKNKEWPNTLSFYGVYGRNKVYEPQWLIRDPRWQLADGQYFELVDELWLVAFTLFRKCRLSKRKPKTTVSVMSVTEIARLSGMHKTKVSRALARLVEIGLLKRVDRTTWDLSPAIERAKVNGTYRYRTIPRAVADLVAFKTGPRKRFMSIKQLRLWSLAHHKWVMAKTKLPYVAVAAMKTALSCEKTSTVTKTYKTAQEAGFLRRMAPEPVNSALFDPTTILDVLRARVSVDLSQEPVEIVFDKLFMPDAESCLTVAEFEAAAETATKIQRQGLRALLSERFQLSSTYVSIGRQVTSWNGVRLRPLNVVVEEQRKDRLADEAYDFGSSSTLRPYPSGDHAALRFALVPEDPDFGLPGIESSRD